MKTSSEIGRQAEDFAASFLQTKGYKIVDRNWRTRWCEIDLVATKNKQLLFVEVKYRKSQLWGDGLAAIGSKKLHQMTFAAELWVQHHNWSHDYQLACIGISGQTLKIDDFIIID